MSDAADDSSTLLVRCNRCGDVVVPTDHAWVCQFTGSARSELRFACPECGIAQIKLIEHDHVDLLLANGAQLAVGHVDLSGSDAFRADDLLAFRDLLADDESLWADLLAANDAAAD